MKLEEITGTKSGIVYFIDDTKGICTIIENQKKLDAILKNNKF